MTIPTPNEKLLAWLHGEVKTPPFSRDARIEAGELLGRIQRGDVPDFPHARPMTTIGPACIEIRVKDRTVDWRIILHVAPDVIVVLDVFSKKTQRTPLRVIDNCRRRLRMFLSTSD